MKLATPIGALSGKSVQVILPAVVSMMATGSPDDVVAAGLAAVVAAGFFAGAVLGAGVVCENAAEHNTVTVRRTEYTTRMEAPGCRASLGRAGEGTRPYVVCDDCELRILP
jgi:hypothetical protein